MFIHDTYLIFNLKEYFLNKVKKLKKYPRGPLFNSKLRSEIKLFKNSVKVIENAILNYNQDFIKIHKNLNGGFLECSNYPNCKFTYKM